jgi:hypothetical protein
MHMTEMFTKSFPLIVRKHLKTDGATHEIGVTPSEEPGECVFGSDGQLRCDAAVIGHVTAGVDGAFAHMVVRDKTFDIVQRSGWHFVVVTAPTGTPVCEFVRFRMRRGGRLRIGTSETKLRAIRSRRWRFDSDDGNHFLVLTVRPLNREAQSQSRPIEVRTREEGWMRHSSNAPLLLTFGCWLIMQWESIVVPGPGGSPILLEGL